MIIHINVHPGAREEKIKKLAENTYRIDIKARAEKGKANAAVIKLLSKELDVPQKDIIIKNPTRRRKRVEIK